MRLKSAWTLSLLVTVSLIIPAVSPVYFREDDVHYLVWARTHAWADCFLPSRAVLFGMFRPVQNLTWWSLYHIAGMNPYPYHAVVLFSYLAGMAAFFAFIRTAFSTHVAIASLLAYGVAFYFLTHIIFWFSDLTYTLELMFAHGALWLFALSIKHNTRRHLAGAAALFCAAVAAKEPAALIVPLVCSLLLAVQWSRLDRTTRRHCAIAAGLMLLAGVWWILLNPAIQSRQGIPLREGAGAVIAFIKHRWSFYAGCLTAFPTILVWVAALFPLSLIASRTTGLAMGIAVIMAILLKLSPDIALLVLICSFSLLILMRHPCGIGAIWATPPLLGIMTLEYMVRTYLVEASFGLAMVCGTSVAPMMDRFIPRLTLYLGAGRKRILMGSAVTVMALGICIGPLLSEKLRALCILSANRQNFAAAVSYLSHADVRITRPLLLIDYQDMGVVYERDILPLADEEKALRQKTMSSISLSAFFPPDTIPVHNLEWWQAHPEVREASLLTLNVREEEFLEGISLRKQTLREWTHGRTRVRLVHITRNEAEPSPSGSTDTSGR